MRKRNGFTLVELLAVIVVLAIIMIIAIPAVLEVMNSARKNSFQLYATKVLEATQTQYLWDSNSGDISGAGIYIYDIKQDLGLTSTGSYTGYVLVDARDVDNPIYSVFMHDNNYMVLGKNIVTTVDGKYGKLLDDNKTVLGDGTYNVGTVQVSQVDAYEESQASAVMATAVTVCETWNTNFITAGDSSKSISCKNRKGYIYQPGDASDSTTSSNTNPSAV